MMENIPGKFPAVYPRPIKMHPFLAGTISGVATVLSQQPFDNIKIQIQVDPLKCPTIPKATLTILKSDGVRGFFKGIVPPLVSVGAVTAISFGIYQNSLEWLEKNNKMPFLVNSFNAGAFVGVTTSFITSPTELLKTKLQIQDATSILYKGNWECLKQIFRMEGYRGVFKGFWITAVREFLGYGSWFATYEGLKQVWGDRDLALIMAGGSAGVISWFAIYPIDTVKSRMQAMPIYPNVGWNKFKTTWECFKTTWKTNPRDFYRGVLITSIGAFPVNALTFLVYEKVMTILRKNKGNPK
jgi:solute carrier family 25 carnitine/acylcarnitine transporter 20/29